MGRATFLKASTHVERDTERANWRPASPCPHSPDQRCPLHCVDLSATSGGDEESRSKDSWAAS